MIAVCDAQGTLYWLPSNEIRILSIDGSTVSSLLTNKDGQVDRSEKCPGCGYPVSAQTSVCPSCELTLIAEE